MAGAGTAKKRKIARPANGSEEGPRKPRIRGFPAESLLSVALIFLYLLLLFSMAVSVFRWVSLAPGFPWISGWK